jgi:hypothetical protein
MKITKEIQVFDTNVLTPGSKVKITGYSCIAEKTFDGDVVEVAACRQEVLTIKHKRRKYEVEHWEFECAGLEIELVEHKQLPPKPLPF